MTFAPGSTPIERVGAVLARSTVAKEPGDEPDQDGAEVIAGLHELGAVRLDGTPGRQAELAVVLTGPRERPSAEAAVTALVQALDAAGRARCSPARDAPVARGLAALRATRGGASSVDSADSPAGQVSLVLALVEQLAGGKGAYGAAAGGATAVLPALGSSVPEPRPADTLEVRGRVEFPSARRVHDLSPREPSWPHRRPPSTSSSPGASPPRSARASRRPAWVTCCGPAGCG